MVWAASWSSNGSRDGNGSIWEHAKTWSTLVISWLGYSEQSCRHTSFLNASCTPTATSFRRHTGNRLICANACAFLTFPGGTNSGDRRCACSVFLAHMNCWGQLPKFSSQLCHPGQDISPLSFGSREARYLRSKLLSQSMSYRGIMEQV